VYFLAICCLLHWVSELAARLPAAELRLRAWETTQVKRNSLASDLVTRVDIWQSAVNLPAAQFAQTRWKWPRCDLCRPLDRNRAGVPSGSLKLI
jgi:hypothetical protein